MAGSGLIPADYAMDPVDVWPENWPAFALFFDMRTQWRTGMGGATGLDYGVLFHLMDMHGTPAAERRQVLLDVQVMEEAALIEMQKKF